MQTIIQLIVDPNTREREAIAIWKRTTGTELGNPSVKWDLLYAGPIHGTVMVETVPYMLKQTMEGNQDVSIQ